MLLDNGRTADARRRGRPRGAALHPVLRLPQRLPGLRAHRRARVRLGLPRPDRRGAVAAADRAWHDNAVAAVRLDAVRRLLRRLPGRRSTSRRCWCTCAAGHVDDGGGRRLPVARAVAMAAAAWVMAARAGARGRAAGSPGRAAARPRRGRIRALPPPLSGLDRAAATCPRRRRRPSATGGPQHAHARGRGPQVTARARRSSAGSGAALRPAGAPGAEPCRARLPRARASRAPGSGRAARAAGGPAASTTGATRAPRVPAADGVAGRRSPAARPSAAPARCWSPGRRFRAGWLDGAAERARRRRPLTPRRARPARRRSSPAARSRSPRPARSCSTPRRTRAGGRSRLVPDYHVCRRAAPSRSSQTVPEAVARLDPTRPLTWISGPSRHQRHRAGPGRGRARPPHLVVVLAGP